MWVWVCVGAGRPGASSSLDVWLQAIVTCLIWVLGSKLGALQEQCTLTHWVISPAPLGSWGDLYPAEAHLLSPASHGLHHCELCSLPVWRVTDLLMKKPCLLPLCHIFHGDLKHWSHVGLLGRGRRLWLVTSPHCACLPTAFSPVIIAIAQFFWACCLSSLIFYLPHFL